MRKYSALKLISGLFKAVGIIIILVSITGIVIAFGLSDTPNSIMIIMAIVFGGFISFLFFYGIGEGIQLMINVANDIQTTADNTYVIATKNSNESI